MKLRVVKSIGCDRYYVVQVKYWFTTWMNKEIFWRSYSDDFATIEDMNICKDRAIKYAEELINPVIIELI